MSGRAKEATGQLCGRVWSAAVPFPVPQGSIRQPRGRPRGRAVAARLGKLIGDELLRPVQVREGDRSYTVPVIAAVIRQTVVQALKGSSPAQRKLIDIVHVMVKQGEASGDGEPPIALEMLVEGSMELEKHELQYCRSPAPRSVANCRPTSCRRPSPMLFWCPAQRIRRPRRLSSIFSALPTPGE